MKQYLELCKHILENGVKKEDRTGTGTISTFGYQMRFDLSKGFPLMTTKDMSGSRLNGIIHELLWFLNGDTNIKYLVDNGVNIWNPDAYREYKNWFDKWGEGEILTQSEFREKISKDVEFATDFGELGPIYGEQWRNFGANYDYDYNSGVDQIAGVIKDINENPDSRRLLVCAWNPVDLPFMALPPCHVLFQFYVANGKLSCQLYQRSGDVFLGVPYNIASYALLTHMIAQQTGLEVGEFVHTLGDAHVYLNHIEQVKLQLSREPKELCQLVIKRKPDSIFDYKVDDFEFIGYEAHPSIVGKVSV